MINATVYILRIYSIRENHQSRDSIGACTKRVATKWTTIRACRSRSRRRRTSLGGAAFIGDGGKFSGTIMRPLIGPIYCRENDALPSRNCKHTHIYVPHAHTHTCTDLIGRSIKKHHDVIISARPFSLDPSSL